MTALQTPYFLWDYDLTDNDIKAILRADDGQKAWLADRAARQQRRLHLVRLRHFESTRKKRAARWRGDRRTLQQRA